jgi:hypothetical protein
MVGLSTLQLGIDSSQLTPSLRSFTKSLTSTSLAEILAFSLYEVPVS